LVVYRLNAGSVFSVLGYGSRTQKLIVMGAIPTIQNERSADNQLLTVEDLIITRNGVIYQSREPGFILS
jgi:hypothetical protein